MSTYLYGLDGAREVGSDGLLAEDVLSRFGSRLDLVGVELGRGADPHSLHLRVVDDFHALTMTNKDKGDDEKDNNRDQNGVKNMRIKVARMKPSDLFKIQNGVFVDTSA